MRVLERPVHYGDLLGIAGRYRSGGDFSVPAEGNPVGFEGYGVVVQAGTDVELEIGTRVAFFPGRGAWSEKALVPAAYVTAIPDTISNEIAAQLHVNPLTAAILVRAVETAGVKPGTDVVVLTAAGSAVARFAIAVLRERSIDAIAVVRSSRGAEELVGQFFGLPVVATDRDDWGHALATATSGKPIKAILDAVGGPIASELFSLLAGGGSVISYGDLTGQPLILPALVFSTRNLRIFGVTVGTWAGLPDAQRAEDMQLAIRIASEQPSLFSVAARYDLSDAGAAADHVDKPGKAGVVLLTSY